MKHFRAVASLAMTSVLVSQPAQPTEPTDRPAPSSTVSAISWGACDDPGLENAGAECGHLEVPLDHARPRGPSITIALSRVRHSVPDERYRAVMLVNPGGPGSSGLTTSTIGELVAQDAGDAYDWIGFDPRGVGGSTPALSCDPEYFAPPRPDYTPRDRATEQVWLGRTAQYAADCGRTGGELLRHMRTEDTARDMDLIRTALGEVQISYYGISYGTYLGQVYATLFPGRIHRMVLDSAVSPERVWDRHLLDQARAFDDNTEAFFAWVARYDSTYRLGSTPAEVRTRWYTERDGLLERPAAGSIGPAEWVDVFAIVAYIQQVWPDLARVFSTWANDRDPTRLLEEFELSFTGRPTAENEYAVYSAVQCTDARWPRSWRTWRTAAAAVERGAPSQVWRVAWEGAPCLSWPAPARRPTEIDGSAAPPFLMTVETLDAATPFAGNLEVRREFPGARLIAVDGGRTHSYSLLERPCVTGRIADYLTTGAVPDRRPGDRADVVCEPLPEPEPGPATGEGSSRARTLPTGARTGATGPG